MFDQLVATESEATVKARKRLESLTLGGIEQAQRVIEKVRKDIIIDRLVDPAVFEFSGSPGSIPGVHLSYTGSGGQYIVHQHALAQMQKVAGVDGRFPARLRDGVAWEKDLLASILNTLFEKGEYLDRKKNPARFLLRHVGDEVRGFLSRSYNRKLMTLPLLSAFVNRCFEAKATPVSSYASDMRVWIKCVLPYVFEPVPGEFVSIGVTFSNSDFGLGRLKIAGSITRIASGTEAVLEDSFSKTHIGSLIQDSDLEMSEETATKELAATVSAMNDVITAALSPENVDRILQAIEYANAERISWSQLKAGLLGVLGKGDIESLRTLSEAQVVDLPPSYSANEEVSVWWAASALSKLSAQEQDLHRKADLEAAAGKLINVESK